MIGIAEALGSGRSCHQGSQSGLGAVTTGAPPTVTFDNIIATLPASI